MTFFRNHLAECPIIAILRGLTPTAADEATKRLWDMGVGLVEVTVQDAAGFDTLEAVAATATAAGRSVGAGSVTSVEAFDRTVNCGASFIVSPGLDVELVDHARSRRIPYLPGVATPSEIQLARTHGVLEQKLFPSSELGGTAYVKAMAGPFPDVQLVPSGGVSIADIDGYLTAGALGVGIGSELTGPHGAQALSDWFARREAASSS